MCFFSTQELSRLKQLIDASELGELRYLSAVRTNFGPVRQDVNAAFDLATHDVAIFNWLLGSEPLEVSATGATYLQPGVEDVVFASLWYPNDVLANIHVSWLNPRKTRQITVVGEAKMITWDDLELSTPLAIYDCRAQVTPKYNDYGEFLRISMWSGDVRLPKISLEEPLRAQARYFLEAVTAGRAKISNGEFSLGVVRTIESINNSLQMRHPRRKEFK